jgi:holliday junction DNA helicase RuvA
VIAHLRGRVARQGEDHAVIDVQGVGYLVLASARSLRRLPGSGEAVELLTDMHVADDAIRLYGFIDEPERAAFRLLQTVQGVGARVALAILGTLGPDGLAAAVAAGDKAALARSPGVGARLAARVTAELKDRLGDMKTTDGIEITAPRPDGTGGPFEDAVAALVRLGFGRPEALLALTRVKGRLGEDLPLNRLIREGLQELST